MERARDRATRRQSAYSPACRLCGTKISQPLCAHGAKIERFGLLAVSLCVVPAFQSTLELLKLNIRPRKQRLNLAPTQPAPEVIDLHFPSPRTAAKSQNK